MVKSEKQKRETMRQGLVTSFNLVGQGLSTFLSSPTYMIKVAYMSALMFGAYQATRLAAAAVMARFGKPQLVRQTSKISTNNIFMVPYMLMRRSLH